MYQIEKMTVEMLRSRSTEALNRALAVQVKRSRKAREWKDVNGMAETAHCITCIERALESRTA